MDLFWYFTFAISLKILITEGKITSQELERIKQGRKPYANRFPAAFVALSPSFFWASQVVFYLVDKQFGKNYVLIISVYLRFPLPWPFQYTMVG